MAVLLERTQPYNERVSGEHVSYSPHSQENLIQIKDGLVVPHD
jgi:hypothetical protein